MKQRFFSTILIVQLFFISAFGQQLNETDLPPGLMYEFKNRYPGVENVQWSMKSESYNADFVFMGNSVSALYDITTKWISSETTYKPEDLPRNIQRYVSSQFSDLAIQSAKFTEQRGEQGYFLLRSEYNNETANIIFDKDGVFQSLTDQQGVEIISGAISSEPGTKPIARKELPSNVNNYVQTNHSGFRITQSYYIHNDEFEHTYFVILTSPLSRDKIQLWFDFRGNLIKKIDPTEKVEIIQDDTSDTKQSRRKAAEDKKPLSESQVPQPVLSTFKKQVKKYEKLSWDTLKGNYVASYYDPNRRINFRAEYKKTGQWIQTFGELNQKNLNPNITKHLNENYPDLRILSVESMNTAARKRYTLVKIYNPQWLNDPMVYHELYFAQSGRLELEKYADNYIDPSDQLNDTNREKQLEVFLEDVDREDPITTVDFKKITVKELPSKAVKHIRSTYPDHRINDTYTLTDDITDEVIYWVILKKEGIRIRTKAIYDFKGNFINEEDY